MNQRKEYLKVMVDHAKTRNINHDSLKKEIEKNLNNIQKFSKLENYDLETILREANSLSKYSSYYINDYFAPTNIDEYASKVEAIEKRFPTFVISDINNNFLQFSVDVILNKKDLINHIFFEKHLGKFLITVNAGTNYLYSCKIQSLKITSTATSNNCPALIDGVYAYHPHIRSDGVVCLGGYANQITKDIANVDYCSVFYNICEVLQEYNPSSLMFPGADISNWLGSKCNICSGFINVGEGVVCAKSKIRIHEDCSEEVDGIKYAIGIIKTCTSCGKKDPNCKIYSRSEILCSTC